MTATGRLFDGRSSRGQEVTATLLGGGLRIDGAGGEPPVFWAWADLPRSCLTVTGTTTVVVRGSQTLEVPGHDFLKALKEAHPRASLFRSPFRTWTATPARFAVTLGVAVGTLVLAFLVLVPWAGDQIAASLPREVESALGASLKADVVAGQKSYPEASLRLQQFWDALNLPVEQPVAVTLVDDGSTVNAFALMGGQVIVYKGLLDECRNADELAGVLAHEAAHGELRHSARLIGRSLAGAFLLSYLLADPTGITGAVLGNVDALRNLQFSREMEAEADAWASRALEGKSDIRALGDLLTRIEKVGLPGWAVFLSSHPATGDRAASWNRIHSSAAADDSLNSRFATLKTTLANEEPSKELP